MIILSLHWAHYSSTLISDSLCIVGEESWFLLSIPGAGSKLVPPLAGRLTKVPGDHLGLRGSPSLQQARAQLLEQSDVSGPEELELHPGHVEPGGEGGAQQEVTEDGGEVLQHRDPRLVTTVQTGGGLQLEVLHWGLHQIEESDQISSIERVVAAARKFYYYLPGTGSENKVGNL